MGMGICSPYEFSNPGCLRWPWTGPVVGIVSRGPVLPRQIAPQTRGRSSKPPDSQLSAGACSSSNMMNGSSPLSSAITPNLSASSTFTRRGTWIPLWLNSPHGAGALPTRSGRHGKRSREHQNLNRPGQPTRLLGRRDQQLGGNREGDLRRNRHPPTPRGIKTDTTRGGDRPCPLRPRFRRSVVPPQRPAPAASSTKTTRGETPWEH